jgi:hypothetical protein
MDIRGIVFAYTVAGVAVLLITLAAALMIAKHDPGPRQL